MKEMLNVPECFLIHLSSLIPHPFLSSLIPHPSSLLTLLHPSALILLLVCACLITACVAVAALSRHQKSSGGELRLEGRVGQVVRALEPEGAVLVGGELWRARTRNGDKIARGQVRIVGARGHWLEVESVA